METRLMLKSESHLWCDNTAVYIWPGLSTKTTFLGSKERGSSSNRNWTAGCYVIHDLKLQGLCPRLSYCHFSANVVLGQLAKIHTDADQVTENMCNGNCGIRDENQWERFNFRVEIPDFESHCLRCCTLNCPMVCSSWLSRDGLNCRSYR